MALRCEFCQKGVNYGHTVSHAKNRLRRIFKPNLQKLKVLKNGVSVRVKFCTNCIKRLKKDGSMGMFTLRKFTSKPKLIEQPVKVATAKVARKVTKETAEKQAKQPSKEEKMREELKIEAIVGLPDGKAG